MPPNVISHHNSNSNSSVSSNSSSSNHCSQSTGVPRFPMDLKTITERLKTRYYCHVYLFRADVMRLFTNCREMFAADSEQVKCANQLQTYFEKKLLDSGFTSNL